MSTNVLSVVINIDKYRKSTAVCLNKFNAVLVRQENLPGNVTQHSILASW